MEYLILHLPRRNDALIVTMLQKAGYTVEELLTDAA
jgi:hypothetical protein